jgi:hypothetical protein
MNANVEYAKKNPSKLRIITRGAKGELHQITNFLTFVRLSEEDLTTVCSMPEWDWMSYGECCEYEATLTKEQILTKEQFDKRVPTTRQFTYELYVKMRKLHLKEEAEDAIEDAKPVVKRKRPQVAPSSS